MFKYQCDICGLSCEPLATRRWENLIGELGLEVVILEGDKPVGDKHVCDDCLCQMFWRKLEKTHNSPINRLKDQLAAREVRCIELERNLEWKKKKIDLRAEEFEVKQRQIESLEAKLRALESRSNFVDKMLNEQDVTHSLKSLEKRTSY